MQPVKMNTLYRAILIVKFKADFQRFELKYKLEMSYTLFEKII